eukprot:TRINITY_DN1567_c0_g1_i3.p3 TRINITY_DN1567_c0_g1~~TRINITY_DN1567_c0_g1_i3.p3  ORF type:complete len:126 (+),score=0.22 TRINITY_DN1567_c0_g1_i3:1210-1587(+)
MLSQPGSANTQAKHLASNLCKCQFRHPGTLTSDRCKRVNFKRSPSELKAHPTSPTVLYVHCYTVEAIASDGDSQALDQTPTPCVAHLHVPRDVAPVFVVGVIVSADVGKCTRAGRVAIEQGGSMK